MITACLSFFDERPQLLQECIAGLASVGIDRLVAVDGPYELYPHSSTRSSKETLDAIRWSCHSHKIDLLLAVRNHAWKDNEVGKRRHMLMLARGAQPRARYRAAKKAKDWLLIVDADHIWSSQVPLAELLSYDEGAVLSFAQVSFAEVFEPDGTPIFSTARPLMRARWDLEMGSNHYTYEVEEGYSTFLDRPLSTMPALDLRGAVRVIHKVHDRPPEERERQIVYYDQRDALGVER